MSALSKPVQKFAALALLVAVIGAFLNVIVLPGWEFVAVARERIEGQRVLLGRLEAAAATSGNATEMQRQADAQPLSRLLLKGDTEAIQLAGLQSIVGDAATKHGIRVVSARALPASERDGLRLVGLRFDVRAELKSLQALLHRIEAMEPQLFVEGLQIRAGAASDRAADRGEALLDSSISIYGVQAPKKG